MHLHTSGTQTQELVNMHMHTSGTQIQEHVNMHMHTQEHMHTSDRQENIFM